VITRRPASYKFLVDVIPSYKFAIYEHAQSNYVFVLRTSLRASCFGVTGRRTGVDANVLSAYVKYAQQMEDLSVDISTVYWIMFHKPNPDDEGGCAFDDLTWRKRDLEFDYITWEGAQKRAREEIVAYDEMAPVGDDLLGIDEVEMFASDDD
jgi:hypothetical protein